MVHIAYCDDKEKVLEKIMNKERFMLIRGAAGRKIPHSRVYAGEELYFIKKGTGLITAKALVKSVQNFVKLTDEEITSVMKEHEKKLNLSENEKKRWFRKCLCLLEFVDLEPIEPLKLDHQTNMDDWLIVENVEDVVEGTSKKFNYDNAKLK